MIWKRLQNDVDSLKVSAPEGKIKYQLVVINTEFDFVVANLLFIDGLLESATYTSFSLT